MGLISVLADGVGSIAAGARANQLVRISGSNALELAPNLPIGQLYGHYSEFENGGAGFGINPAGLNAWINSQSGGGSARTALTGEAGWFQGAASLETGPLTNGSYGLGRQAAMAFSSTSGTWVYECTFSMPALSDGTNTYSVQWGFVDAFPAANGVYVRYTHTLSGGDLEFATAAAATRTVVDSAIALVAGAYYHLRIEVLNNTTATLWIKTTATSSGGTWTDNGVWGTPTATISTNLPSGTGQMTFGGLTILKSAGATTRMIKLGYQAMYRIPAFTRVEPSSFLSDGMLSGGDGVGQALGAPGNTLGIIPAGTPGWFPPQRFRHPIVWMCYGRGGWVNTPTHDMGFVQGGTAGTGAAGAGCFDNSWWGTTGLTTGFVADGYCGFVSAINLKIDAAVQPMVLESIISLPNLSAGGNQFATQFGIIDNYTGGISSGIYIEIDSVANAAAQCKAVTSGVATTVSSGLTILAATSYVLRIVITSTSVTFYVKQDDAAAFGSPVATITTNIPTATALGFALMTRKSSGATSRQTQYGYCFGFQRSSS